MLQARISPTGARLGGPLTSLYRYRGLVRRLILRAKVQGDLQALALLIELAACHSACRKTLAPIQLVVPCPSSLWGRLRGRLDVAHHTAVRLARMADAPYASSPWHLYWRLHKRAQMRRVRHGLIEVRPSPARIAAATGRTWQSRPTKSKGESIVLLVDDVVTSGYTMLTTAAAIKHGDLRFLSLASASCHGS